MPFIASILPVVLYILVVYELDNFSLISVKRLLVLVGCGMVSALYAGDNPDKVEKLVLIYPALCIKDDWVTKYPEITDMPEVVNSFGMQLGRAYVEGLYDLDVYGRISKYTGPVQILHGDQDRLVPISYSEKAHEAYKNSSFKVMPGAGHGFRGEVQQEAIGIIKEFLGR